MSAIQSLAAAQAASAIHDFSLAVGDAVVRVISSQHLAFVSDKRLQQIRAEFASLVQTHCRDDLSDERKRAILAAIDANGARHLFLNRYRPGDIRSLNQSYLEFPDRIKTLQWEVFMAITRPPLNSEELTRLESQRRWMRDIIARLADDRFVSQKDVLQSLDSRFADPLCTPFDRPMSEAQFALFQKAITTRVREAQTGVEERTRTSSRSIKPHNPLFHIVNDLVVRALWAQYQGENHQNLFPLIDDDPVGSSGAANGYVHLGFMSNRLFRGDTRWLGPMEDDYSVVDATTGNWVSATPDQREPARFAKWIEGQDKGDFGLSRDARNDLIAFRGGKLAMLSLTNWIQIDAISSDELRATIEKQDRKRIALRSYYEAYQNQGLNHPPTEFVGPYIGVLTREGSLAVVHIEGFSGPEEIEYRVRPRAAVRSTRQPSALPNLKEHRDDELGVRFKIPESWIEYLEEDPEPALLRFRQPDLEMSKPGVQATLTFRMLETGGKASIDTNAPPGPNVTEHRIFSVAGVAARLTAFDLPDRDEDERLKGTILHVQFAKGTRFYSLTSIFPASEKRRYLDLIEAICDSIEFLSWAREAQGSSGTEAEGALMPSEEPTIAWGKPDDGVMVRVESAKAGLATAEWPHLVIELTYSATNAGPHMLHLPDNGISHQIEVDGRWYEWRPVFFSGTNTASRAPANTNQVIEVESSVLLDFAPGQSHSNQTMRVAGNWRAIPEGKEYEYTQRRYSGFRVIHGEDYGDELALSPGRHQLRIALICPPARAGLYRMIRAVSEPIELEIAAREARLNDQDIRTANLAFGVVEERVLALGSMDFMLDLDTGQTMDAPATPREETLLMDVHPDQVQPGDKPSGLVAMNGLVFRNAQNGWAASAQDIQRALQNVSADGNHRMPVREDRLPATWFFTTRSGAMGVLQVTGFTEEPAGVKLRHKLVNPQEQAGSATVQPASGQVPPKPQTKSTYTLDEILKALSERSSKYQAAPVRFEYTRTANEVIGEPARTEERALSIQWNNFREEAHQARPRHQTGAPTVNYLVRGVRAVTAPSDDEAGSRVRYLAHDTGHPIENTLWPHVHGPDAWFINYLREVEQAGNLKIETGNLPDGEDPTGDAPRTVTLVAGGYRLMLVPEWDWAIAEYLGTTARGHRQYGDLWFPRRITRDITTKDFNGGWMNFRDEIVLRSVNTHAEIANDTFQVPQPRAADRVQVAYPKWKPEWDNTPVEAQTIRDAARFEHVFTWSDDLNERDARIWQVSIPWRDASRVRRALEPRPGEEFAYGDADAPLPFLALDSARIVWASYDPSSKRMIPVGQLPGEASVEDAGFRFEAGFIPEKTEIMVGEPIYVTFYVRNTGTEPIYLETGGDGRSIRSYRFQFSAADLQGDPVRDPHPNPAHFGGLQGPPPEIKPGKTYSERLQLAKWLAFDRPGQYTVRGARTLQFPKTQDFTRDYALVYPLSTSFSLKVVSRTVRGISARIETLGERLRAEENESEARLTAQLLTELNDNRAIDPLLWAANRWSGDSWALNDLAAFKDDPRVVALYREALIQSQGNSRCSDAARLMGESGKGEFLPDLMRAFTNEEDKFVLTSIATALGKFGDRRAVPILKQHRDHTYPHLRLQVEQALVQCGEPLDVERFQAIIRSTDPTWHSAAWFVSEKTGDAAARILAECLDFEHPGAAVGSSDADANPAWRNAMLLTYIAQAGGPKFPYERIHYRPATMEETETNRQTLQKVRQWLRESRHPGAEEH